ncbi:MAG: hypothetical protein R2724_03180 [Bryobacterales bacterium]
MHPTPGAFPSARTVGCPRRGRRGRRQAGDAALEGLQPWDARREPHVAIDQPRKHHLAGHVDQLRGLGFAQILDTARGADLGNPAVFDEQSAVADDAQV